MHHKFIILTQTRFLTLCLASTRSVLWNVSAADETKAGGPSIGYRDKSRCVRRRVAAAFLFPGNLSARFIDVEPAGQKDDRSARCCARESVRASGRAIALSLIFSDWLAGLPIWPITGELRGTAKSKLHGRRDDRVRAKARRELYACIVYRCLSLSSPRPLLLSPFRDDCDFGSDRCPSASDRINEPVFDRDSGAADGYFEIPGFVLLSSRWITLHEID